MCELSCPCGAEERSMPPEKLLDLLAHQLALYAREIAARAAALRDCGGLRGLFV